jgi:hypothetical protein
VNHVDPETGAFLCTVQGTDLDCASTRFDSCMVKHACWQGQCEFAVQKRIATFLRCFEGPNANTEVETDPARRLPCFLGTGFAQSDWDSITACAANGTEYAGIAAALNVSKTKMLASLGDKHGLFPHVFVDGQHQWNNSWCGLTRTLCDQAAPRGSQLQSQQQPPAACRPIDLPFRLLLTDPAIDAATAASAAFQGALRKAAEFAVSNASFPKHFDTDDDALDGAPSYVDSRAVLALTLHNCTADEGVATGVSRPATSPPQPLKLDLVLTMLAAFGADATVGLKSPAFVAYLVWALGAAGFRVQADQIAVTVG